MDFSFSGTSTDLVPQLLGMFDELARRSDGYEGDRMILPSSCGIPAVLQKRLSMVPIAHRGSVFGQLCTNGDLAKVPMHQDVPKSKAQEDEYDEIVADATDNSMLETVISVTEHEGNGESIGKPIYERRETNGLTTTFHPLYHGV